MIGQHANIKRLGIFSRDNAICIDVVSVNVGLASPASSSTGFVISPRTAEAATVAGEPR
jgi:hypothetical protein